MRPTGPPQLGQTLRSAGKVARCRALSQCRRIYQAVVAALDTSMTFVARDQYCGLLDAVGVDSVHGNLAAMIDGVRVDDI